MRVAFWHDEDEAQLWEGNLPAPPSMGDTVVLPPRRVLVVTVVEWRLLYTQPSAICHVEELK